MREKRRKWFIDGRLRGHNYISYSEYKHANRLFRSHHGVCAENFLLEINSEIDNAAEADSNFFWKRVNSRRKQSHSHAGSDLTVKSAVTLKKSSRSGAAIFGNCTRAVKAHILILFSDEILTTIWVVSLRSFQSAVCRITCTSLLKMSAKL